MAVYVVVRLIVLGPLSGKIIMKANRFFAAALIVCAGGNHVFGQGASDKRAADRRAVSEALTKVRELKTASYHEFLRKASQIFPPVCVGRDWSHVSTLIEKQMCPIVESWDGGKRRYYLLKKRAFSFDNGHSLDAYIWLSANNFVSSEGQARSLRVFEADIVLGATINISYTELMKQQRFPRNSVLDVVLRSKEVKREGKRRPFVKNVFVNYGSILERWIGVKVSGFDVTVEFAASREDDAGGKRMYFFVRSGLDPVVPQDDKDVASKDFAPKDTLGEVVGYGSNEW